MLIFKNYLDISIVIFCLFYSFQSIASASKFECKYFNQYLVLETNIIEPTIHKLKINGETTITELSKSNWFVEEVECDKTGYIITASHIQLDDAAKKVFHLKFTGKKSYTFVEIN